MALDARNNDMTAHGYSLAIGALAGLGSAAIQASAPSSESAYAMLVPVLSAVVGASVSYGIMKATIKTIERDIHQSRQDIGHLYDLMRDVTASLAHIKGQMERKP
jgi:hypothetical protein